MKEEKKTITQPTTEEQKELDAILNHSTTYVEVRGKQWKASPLYNGTIRKMTHIVLTEKAEDKVNTKCVAAFRLNGYWSILFFYWIVWRWFYYVKQYRHSELLPYINECKKKMEVEAYSLCTIFLIGMTDTTKAMTREEVRHFQAEQLMGQLGHSQKSSTE